MDSTSRWKGVDTSFIIFTACSVEVVSRMIVCPCSAVSSMGWILLHVGQIISSLSQMSSLIFVVVHGEVAMFDLSVVESDDAHCTAGVGVVGAVSWVSGIYFDCCGVGGDGIVWWGGGLGLCLWGGVAGLWLRRGFCG